MICVGVLTVKLVKRVREIASQDGGANAVALASKPVQVSTNTLTQKDIRKHGKEFRIRQYFEGTKKNSRHDQGWDADALKRIESWITSNYGGDQEGDWASPEALGDKLAGQAGFNDPLVLTLAAVDCKERHEKVIRLERALVGFQQNSQHRAYPKFFATVSLANEMGSESQRTRSLDPGAVQHFRTAFTDGSFEPGDEPEIAEILVTGWGSSFFERNAAQLYSIPGEAKTYPWLALMLEGQFHIKEAWKARGGGWADSVSTKGCRVLAVIWQRRARRYLRPGAFVPTGRWLLLK